MNRGDSLTRSGALSDERPKLSTHDELVGRVPTVPHHGAPPDLVVGRTGSGECAAPWMIVGDSGAGLAV